MIAVTVVAAAIALLSVPILPAQQRAPAVPGNAAVVPTAVGSVASDVSLVDTTPLVLVAADNTSVNGTVFVTAGADRTISLTCVLRSASGAPVTVTKTSVGNAEVKKSSNVPIAVPFTLTLSTLFHDDFPLTGYITVTLSENSAVRGLTRPLAITIRPGTGAGAEGTLFSYAAVAATLAVALAALVIALKEGVDVFGHRMGSPNWSFTDSWSSTITIGGAALTSFAGFAALPEQGHTLSRSTYTVVSLIIAGLVGLAPGVYNLFRKPVETPPVVGVLTIVQYHGLVVMFLVAALFTVTGALSQLELFKLLVADLAVAGVVAQPTADALRVVWWGLQLVTFVYAITSLVQTVNAQGTPDGAGVRTKLFVQKSGAAEVRLPDWNLL